MANGFVLNSELRLRVNKGDLVTARSQIDSSIRGSTVNVNAKVSPQSIRQTSQLAASLKQVRKESISSGDAVEEFGKRVGLAGKRYLAFSIATIGVVKGLSKLKEGFADAADFERQILRIGQVSQRSLKQLGSLRQEILGITSRLGVDSAEIAESAVTLAQTGRPLAQIRKDLEAISKARLSPTFGSAKETVEGLIAVQSQFRKSALSTEQILSKLNTVAAQFPVEAGDLVTAIQKAGGAFSSAGGDLDQLLALFTAVRSTSRESADTIATSFRTITGRLARTKTRDFLKEQLGIDLVENGKLLAPFEGLLRITDAIKERGISTQSPLFSKIVEEIGGIRQRAKVIPLLNEMDKAEKILNTSRSAGNSITRDSESAQEALATQIQSVREEFKKFIDNVIQDPAFRGFASNLFEITKGLIRIGDAARPLIPLVGVLGTVFAGRALIGGSFGKFAAGIKGNPVKLASGGKIPGVGTRDTVPAILRPGEVVLNPIQQRRLGDITGSSPLDLFKAAGVPGFSGGGRVPGSASELYDPDRGLLGRQAQLQTLLALLNKQSAKLGSGRGRDPREFSRESRRLSEETGAVKKELAEIGRALSGFGEALDTQTSAVKTSTNATNVSQVSNKRGGDITALFGTSAVREEGIGLRRKPIDTGLVALLGDEQPDFGLSLPRGIVPQKTSPKSVIRTGISARDGKIPARLDPSNILGAVFGPPRPSRDPGFGQKISRSISGLTSKAGELSKSSNLAAIAGIGGSAILSSDLIKNEDFQEVAASFGAVVLQAGILNSALKQSVPILQARAGIEKAASGRAEVISRLNDVASKKQKAKISLEKARQGGDNQVLRIESDRLAKLERQRSKLIELGKAESGRIKTLERSIVSQERLNKGIVAAVAAAGILGTVLSNIGEKKIASGDSSGVGFSVGGGALTGAATLGAAGALAGAKFGAAGVLVGGLIGLATSANKASESLATFRQEAVKAFTEAGKTNFEDASGKFSDQVIADFQNNLLLKTDKKDLSEPQSVIGNLGESVGKTVRNSFEAIFGLTDKIGRQTREEKSNTFVVGKVNASLETFKNLSNQEKSLASQSEGADIRKTLLEQAKEFPGTFEEFVLKFNPAITAAVRKLNPTTEDLTVPLEFFYEYFEKEFKEIRAASLDAKKLVASGQSDIFESFNEINKFMGAVSERTASIQKFQQRASFFSGGGIGQESFASRFENVRNIPANNIRGTNVPLPGSARERLNNRALGLGNLFGTDIGQKFSEFSNFLPSAEAFVKRIQSLAEIDDDILKDELDSALSGQSDFIAKVFKDSVLQAFPTSGDGKLDVSEIDIVSKIAEVTKGFGPIEQAQAKLNQLFEEHVSRLDENFAKERQLREQLVQGRLSGVDIRQKSSDILTGLTGQKSQLGFEGQRKQIITGGLDSNRLGQRLRAANDRVVSLTQRSRDVAVEKGAGSQEFLRLSDAISVQIGLTNKYTNALQFLTDITSRSAEAQERFRRAEEDRLAKKSILERKATGTPQEVREINRNEAILSQFSKNKNVSKDLSREGFAKALEFAKSFGEAIVPQTGKSGKETADELLLARLSNDKSLAVPKGDKGERLELLKKEAESLLSKTKLVPTLTDSQELVGLRAEKERVRSDPLLLEEDRKSKLEALRNREKAVIAKDLQTQQSRTPSAVLGTKEGKRLGVVLSEVSKLEKDLGISQKESVISGQNKELRNIIFGDANKSQLSKDVGGLAKDAAGAQSQLNITSAANLENFGKEMRNGFLAAFKDLQADQVIIRAAKVQDEGRKEQDQFNNKLAEAISAFPEQIGFDGNLNLNVNLNGGAFLTEIEDNIKGIAIGIVKTEMNKLTEKLNIPRIS